MSDRIIRPEAFWTDLEARVVAKVDAALFGDERLHAPLIAYLLDLEELARAECVRRQTIQIIASGRSLLGDRKNLGRKTDLIAHRL